MSTRQLQPTWERSWPEEWPSGREMEPSRRTPRTNRRPPLALGKGVARGADRRTGCQWGWPSRADSRERPSSSKVAAAAKGLPDRDSTGLPWIRENISGVPGLSWTRQNSRWASARGRAWWKMSLSPTDTPPVVMTQSNSPALSLSASATARGSSGHQAVAASSPSCRHRAASWGRLEL